MNRDMQKSHTAAAALGILWGAVLIIVHRLGLLDAVYCLLASVMLALIGDIDRNRHIIPNMSLVILFSLRAVYLIIKAIGGEPFETAAADSFIGLIAVSLMCLAAGVIFHVLGHGDAVGMGDYKYLAVLGWSIGAMRIIQALFAALAATVIYTAVRRTFFNKKMSADRLAFAPFLSFGAMLMLW